VANAPCLRRFRSALGDERDLVRLSPCGPLHRLVTERWPPELESLHPLPGLRQLYPAMLVIKVVCRWPFCPSSQRHLHLDNCASRMAAKPKRKRYEKRSEDRIHQHPAQPLCYTESFTLTVTPMRCATRRTWSSPRNSFGKAGARIAARSVIQRLDGHVPVKERAQSRLVVMGSFLGSNYVLLLGHSRSGRSRFRHREMKTAAVVGWT